MDALLPQSVGWYGKLPSRGDFVGRGLPRAWLRTWDDWLQRALAQAAHRCGAQWRERLLAMPAWQCVVLPAKKGLPAWCGVVTASTDRVGRAFPLLLAEAHEPNELDAADFAALQARGEQIAGWLDEAIRQASPEEVDAATAQLAATPWPRAIAPQADAHERLADWRQRWPLAGSFWWRMAASAEACAPLAEPWPPRESIVLEWLGTSGSRP